MTIKVVDLLELMYYSSVVCIRPSKYSKSKRQYSGIAEILLDEYYNELKDLEIEIVMTDYDKVLYILYK